MYDLFIANKHYSSWSLRPWLLMQQLGIPFREHARMFKDGGSIASFRSFSPSGRAPCLHADGMKLWDSLAITEFLAERHPGVWPADAAARAWARCAAAEMHSGFGALRNICAMSCGVRVRLHEVTSALQADLDRLSELWQDGLNRFGGAFLAGEAFTAVDAFFAPVAFRVQTYGLNLPTDAMTYVNSLLALPGMRQWYAEALREAWRDPAHEEEVLAQGALLSDLRVAGV